MTMLGRQLGQVLSKCHLFLLRLKGWSLGRITLCLG